MRSFVRALLLLALLAPSSLYGTEEPQSAHLVVLHVNDSHGHTQSWLDQGASVGGYARLKTAVDAIRKTQGADHVILLHAGDEFSRGDALTSATLGQGNIAIMNQIGFAAWTPGNGEFYSGAANLQKRIAEASFPVLAGNVSYRLKGEPLAQNSTVITLQGVRVGLFGLCFLHASHPSSLVLKVEDPAIAAKRIVPELRKTADVVIALDHIGVDEDRKLAAAVPGIDLIVGGHTHTVLPRGEQVAGPEGWPVLIAQAGDHLRYLGRVDLDLRRTGQTWALQKATAQLIPLDASIPEDPAIKALIARLWPATQPATQPVMPASAAGK